MVASIPEKLLQSIEDVVKSNRTTALFDGLLTKNQFAHFKNKNKSLLLKRREKERETLYSQKRSNMRVFRHSCRFNVGMFSSARNLVAQIIKECFQPSFLWIISLDKFLRMETTLAKN